MLLMASLRLVARRPAIPSITAPPPPCLCIRAAGRITRRLRSKHPQDEIDLPLLNLSLSRRGGLILGLRSAYRQVILFDLNIFDCVVVPVWTPSPA